MKKVSLLAITILVLFSCSSKRKIIPSGDANYTYSKGEMLDMIRTHNQDFTFFNSGFSFDFSSDRYELSGTGVARMQKDSAIWTVIKKIGLEVARLKITKDSFALINRFEGTYMLRDLNYLKLAGVLDVTMNDVQKIIIGNVMIPIAGNCSIDEMHSNTLTCKDKKYDLTYTFDPVTGHIKSMKIDEKRQKRQLYTEYEMYKNVANEKLIPLQRKISFQSTEGSINLNIQFDNIELDNPKDMKFIIPQHYEKT